MYWYNSTADEIENGNADIAILPIGSTEQHGPHLPIATDYLIASALSEKIAQSLGAFLLPALPISTCLEHRGKKGSVWIKPVTFMNVVADIAKCLKDQGFNKIVFLNCHGGNFALGPAVRELNASNPDIKVIILDFEKFLPQMLEKKLLECKDNLHACEYETSLILYLHSELVRKEKIEDSVPSVTREYLNYDSIFKYSSNGVWGRPSLATAEKGEKIFNYMVSGGADYIVRAFDFFAGADS